MNKIFILYKENNSFFLLSPKELPNSKKILFFGKEIYQIEEDSLDFIFQIFEEESIFISDTSFIQNYGTKFKKLNYYFIDSNKFLLTPAKYAILNYSLPDISDLINKCPKEKQKISLEKDSETVIFTEKLFSYCGSSQQMNLHILNSPIKLINEHFYIFNPNYIKKRPLIKNTPLNEDLNFLDKDVFFRLYYIAHLYEGWILGNMLEFKDSFLNKMIGKKSEYPYLVPFSWIRTFKEEIHNIDLKNTIYITPRINFEIKNLC
jgi:hypothetical protein